MTKKKQTEKEPGKKHHPALEKELHEKEKLIEEYVDDLKRLKADFENHRKRQEKESLKTVEFAAEKIITRLLPVLDNFERAIASAQETGGSESLLEGFRLIYRQLIDLLTAEGLEQIEAMGEDFDPSRHEAMMRIESPGSREDEVVDVFEKGYLLKGRVIRPAKVRVAKNN